MATDGGFLLSIFFGKSYQAIKLYTEVENWEKSAICARNLVDSMLSTGELNSAYEISKQSLEYALEYAKKSGHWFEELRAHVAIASVLYLQGKLGSATEHCVEAEKFQKKNQPEHQQLVSVSGFWYCLLLLQQSTDRTQLDDILKRGVANIHSKFQLRKGGYILPRLTILFLPVHTINSTS